MLARKQRLEQQKREEAQQRRIEEHKLYERIKNNIIDQIVASESTPSINSNKNLLQDITIIIRQYLHASWCLQLRGEYCFEKLKENLLFKPLRELFKTKLIQDGFQGDIDTKINDSIEFIFRDFLVKANIEEYCISLLSDTQKRLNETDEDNNDPEKMSGVFHQLYKDAVAAYKLLDLNVEDIDNDNNDKVQIFEEITGVTLGQNFSSICRDLYSASNNKVAYLGILFAIAGIITTDTFLIKHRFPTELFLLTNIVYLAGGSCFLRGYVKGTQQEKLSTHQKQTYLSLADDLVSLMVVDSLSKSLEDKKNKSRPTPTYLNDEKSPSSVRSDCAAEYNLFQPVSHKRQKTTKGKDKDKYKDDRNAARKMSQMRQRIKASINENFPLANENKADPTWFEETVSKTSQFKLIENSNTEDCFVLLPDVDIHPNKLFENIDPINKSKSCLKRLKTSANTILECTLNGKPYDIDVRWELKCRGTDDRILVGRICPDEGSSSNLYVGFKYIEGGFHDDTDFSRVLGGLANTTIDLNSLPQNERSHTNTMGCSK